MLMRHAQRQIGQGVIFRLAVVLGANAGSLQTQFQDRGELSDRGYDPGGLVFVVLRRQKAVELPHFR